MQMSFKKATKAQANLHASVFGPSGAGKTFTSLRVGTGLAGGRPIAVIDTERGSASKYADRFTFDVLELEDYEVMEAEGFSGVRARPITLHRQKPLFDISPRRIFDPLGL